MSQHRVIKFRVWDKYHEKFAILEISNNNSGCAWKQIPETVFDEFTGLVDKNGVEIYENDFLKDDRNIYLIKWSEKEAGFRVDRKGWLHEHFVTEINGLKELVICGNVYENPELLNGT
jgi:hypothetical protein